MRPIMAEPPVYSLLDLDERVSLRHVLDAHEILDLKAAMAEKAEKAAKR